MAPVIFIILSFIATVAIAVPAIFLHSRKLLREQKNYERGLKMVPLLIHLPPPSEDKEGGARDDREVVDENISKAQIVYTIIYSTLQKGLKSKFYGQRHFAFEIIATHGTVKLYAAVPLVLTEVVTQAVVSAYPSARLEEVAEHNIFSPVGHLSGTSGGEFTLKENFAYPIATYQDIKRDPMQSLLNALSTLEKDDGVGIQILMRPAAPEWRKKASAIASSKRKGKKDKKPAQVISSWFKDAFLALWQPPEEKKKEGESDEKLSNLDQNVLDAIDDKTRHAGYETLIRVVASSNISQKSQALLRGVTSAFALFDAPGKNGFKFNPAKDTEQFVTAFILRLFPQQNDSNILNAVELATLFHFPDQKNIPTSQLQRQASKQVDAPRNMPPDGLFLGYNLFRGIKKAIRMALIDRQRHMYIVGQTGTGKSTFLTNLALQDMLNGDGFAYIDPHGDEAENLMAMVPRERTEDVIYFCPSDMEYPLGLNMFEFSNPDQKDFIIQETINMLYKLYDPNRQGMIGARYEHIFRNCALTIMADPNGGTFIDIPRLFTDKQFVTERLKYVTDQNVIDFWNKEVPASERSNDFGELKSWFVSKFGAFLSNEMMRNIIGQSKSSFNLRDIMDNKKILIVNLSKGKTGDLNSKLLGMIFVMKFQAAAMSRVDTPEDDRQDFCLYVDEFQNFSTDSFATIMSEARKFHLNLIVANQFTTQLTEEIRDAVFGNVGTVVAFRIGQNDMDALSKYFQPLFDADDLLRVPNYNTIVRTLINGVPTQPFSMATVPPLGTPNPKLGAALKQLSAAKYGKPRAKVTTEIFGRLATKSVSSSPSAQQMSTSLSQGGPSSQPRMRQRGSFLDEWLAKKQTPQATMTNRPTPMQPQINTNPASIQATANPIAPYPSVTIPSAPQSDKGNNSMAVPPSQTVSMPVVSQTGGNVQYSSSNPVDEPQVTLDKEKVASLADELMKDEKSQDSGHIDLRTSDDMTSSSEDTIYIDREGTLHNTNEVDTTTVSGSE